MPLRAATYDWTQSGDIAGIDAAGRAVTDDGLSLFALPVPHPETIEAIFGPGQTGQIALQRTGGEVDALRSDLRLIISASTGVTAFRLVDDVSDTLRWAGFGWQAAGRMPFDRATAIASDGRTLWIGTAFGLRRLSPGAPLGMPREIGAPSSASLDGVPAIDRIGRPAAVPARLMVRDVPGRCADIASTGTTAPCADAALLDTVQVHRDDLWDWTVTARGLTGDYLLRDQTRLPIVIGAGQPWPHDRLVAQVQCDGTTYEM